MSDELREAAQHAADRLRYGADYDTLYRVPAGEDYPYGEAVGFAVVGDFAIAVDWYKDADGTEVVKPSHFAVNLGEGAPFPASTEWMITSNSAIDYGLN